MGRERLWFIYFCAGKRDDHRGFWGGKTNKKKREQELVGRVFFLALMVLVVYPASYTCATLYAHLLVAHACYLEVGR